MKQLIKESNKWYDSQNELIRIFLSFILISTLTMPMINNPNMLNILIFYFGMNIIAFWRIFGLYVWK